MHNETPCSRLLGMHLLLECICCTVWISPPGYICWKLVSWWDTLEAKRSINGFPIFTQSLWNTDGASFHSEESFLRRDSTSACLFSELGRYSAVTATFFLNSSSQICFERQTICNFFVLPFSQSNSGSLYCPSEYAVTLFPVLSKRFPGLVLVQEVPVRLCASFSPAESMSLQFSFLLRLNLNLWVKHLSVKELELEDELRSFHCIFRCFSTTKKAPIEIFCLVTLEVRKQQKSFAGAMAKIVDVRWPNTFANSFAN